MNRSEKANEVESLRSAFAQAKMAVVTDYKGLSANDFNQLRLKLREKDSHLKVVKNRLAKLALKGSPHEALVSHLTGTTAVTFAKGEPTLVAKVFAEFGKEHEAVAFKTAMLDGKNLSRPDFVALSKLPSRDELIATLMGTMMSPARGLVTVLAQIPRQVVNVLAAIRDQKEKESSKQVC